MADKNKSKNKDNWFIRHKVLTGIFGIIGLLVMAGLSADPQESNQDSPNKPVANKQESTPEPEDPNPHFSDGTHIIGEDIEPGTYRLRETPRNCYYSRLAGFSGAFEDIIANENTSYPAIITIEPTDKGFKSTRCGTWTQNLTQITESMTTFTDGMYIVGTDIEPGTYKNDGSDGCYYARLSGFSGAFSNIISNENSDDQAIVTIAATDKGFKSSRCGTWAKLE